MRKTSFSILAVLLVFGLGLPRAGAIVFSDGTFDDADWNTIVEIRGIGPVGSGSGMQVSPGGNPGDYREVMAFRDPDEAGLDNSTRVISIYAAGTYNPATMGAIASIDLAIDAIQLIPECCSGGSLGAVVMQDGVVYQGVGGVPIPDLDWTSHSFLGLTESSFFLVGSPAVHPDFSATGLPVSLGWVYVISSGSGAPVSRTVGFDNWMMTVTPVAVVGAPEPTTLAILGLGLAGLGLARRKRTV